MKIYTKTGDDGTTGLFGGGRVGKDHPRVAAYGDVDELNSYLGAVRALRLDPDVDIMLARAQAELFALGADLATPHGTKAASVVKRLGQADALWLEQAIDTLTGELSPLQTFILPGGSAAGASIHVARSVCRRAERAVALLAKSEGPSGGEAGGTFDGPLVYLNRLSDFLFTLARVVNRRAGFAEEPWQP